MVRCSSSLGAALYVGVGGRIVSRFLANREH
jgi:hypothetical protein